MMHKRIIGWALLCATVAPAAAWAASDDLKPFPAAEAGQRRFVIRLPPVEVPDEHKVELIVGKTMQVDCNRQFFGAEITTKVAQGWGFDYHVVGPIGPAASTMMACPPGVPKRDEFVRANLGNRADGAGLLRYNPKVPVVVYMPDGFELRYRVWRAGSETGKASRE